MTANISTVPGSAGRRLPPGGSRKGVPNKITADVKGMVLEALHHAGGAEYLFTQAFDNPKAFLALVGKVLPLQVVGDPANPVQFEIIERRIVRPDHVAAHS